MGKDSRKRKDPEELGDAPPPKNHAEDDDDESDEVRRLPCARAMDMPADLIADALRKL